MGLAILDFLDRAEIEEFCACLFQIAVQNGNLYHRILQDPLEQAPIPDVSLPSECDILQFEKRCEARQNEIRDGSVLAHVTKRIAATTPPRALVVLRLLLNNPPRDGLFLAKLHNPLSYIHIYPFSRNRVESRGGAVSCSGPVSTPPLIIPDVRVSRIRLSDQGVFMLSPTGGYSLRLGMQRFL